MANTFFFHKTYNTFEIPLRKYLLLRLILFRSYVKQIFKKKNRKREKRENKQNI